jgi:hypothetical protein
MGRRVDKALDPALSGTLGRRAEACERLLKACIADESEPPAPILDALQLSIAGMQAAVRLQSADPELLQASLGIAATLAREGAETVRRHDLDEQLLGCADACERAALICEDALRRAA